METTVYLVRHCQPNFENHEDALRELSLEGLQDRSLLVQYFKNKKIDLIISSPYKRAIDTIAPVAEMTSLPIHEITEFRERTIANCWIDDFTQFTKQQWQDFRYKLPGGESLAEVQDRNISALQQLLQDHNGKSMIISSHGTAISTIIHSIENRFGYEHFEQIKGIMPFVVVCNFSKLTCTSINFINLFTNETHVLYNHQP